jgi:hypothetical protein
MTTKTGDGGIVGVGTIGIVLIVFGACMPLSTDWKWSFILLGIGILLALVAGATFRLHWIVGTVFGVAAVVVFLFALTSFSNAINPKVPSPVSMLNQLLLFLI